MKDRRKTKRRYLLYYMRIYDTDTREQIGNLVDITAKGMMIVNPRPLIEGQTYRGAGGFHPEGGHQVIDPNGPLCYCGAHGCWESLASGTAIARDARAMLGNRPNSFLLSLSEGDLGRIDARMVAEAALQGDPLARGVIGRAAEYFALGLFNLLMLFFPEVIVLSGGVMHSSELFMPAIHRALQYATPYLPTQQVDVRLAQLGYYAGIYGAAYAILTRVQV